MFVSGWRGVGGAGEGNWNGEGKDRSIARKEREVDKRLGWKERRS